jgi:integrase
MGTGETQPPAFTMLPTTNDAGAAAAAVTAPSTTSQRRRRTGHRPRSPPAQVMCRRDRLLLQLSQPPFGLSLHAIANLRVTDFTEDRGATWLPHLATGRGGGQVEMTPAVVDVVRAYLFRHGRKGEPFRDWRPDIGPYVFQARGHHALGHMSAMTVRSHIMAATRINPSLSPGGTASNHSSADHTKASSSSPTEEWTGSTASSSSPSPMESP